MSHIFSYRCDKRTIYWTLLYVVVYLGLGAGFYLLYEGGYLSAWFASCVGALLVLMALSIPRKIVVEPSRIEVRCLLDITELERKDIVAVRPIEPREMRWVFPLFGGCGFFGYYGKFFDIKELDIVNIYASEWDNFVEITDIYDTRTYISCREADIFINTIRQAQELCKEKMNEEQELQQAI